MDRSSGILLPVSALPGPCGIGDLGADARDFIAVSYTHLTLPTILLV